MVNVRRVAPFVLVVLLLVAVFGSLVLFAVLDSSPTTLGGPPYCQGLEGQVPECPAP